MKYLFSLALVSLLVAVGCSSAPSAQELCDQFSKLCASSNGSDGGVSVSITCKTDSLESASNKEDLKSCLDSAKDCNGAMACLLTAKP